MCNDEGREEAGTIGDNAGGINYGIAFLSRFSLGISLLTGDFIDF